MVNRMTDKYDSSLPVPSPVIGPLANPHWIAWAEAQGFNAVQIEQVLFRAWQIWFAESRAKLDLGDGNYGE